MQHRTVAATLTAIVLTASTTVSFAAHTPQQEKNIQNAHTFVIAFMHGDADTAAKFMSPDYVSHAAGAKTPDKDSTLKAYKAWAPQGIKWKVTKEQAFADGDMVIYRYLCTPLDIGPDAPKEVIGWEIMKFDANHLVVEHWAAEQEVPKEVANPHGIW
jgi:hypothetical protein